MKAVFMTVIATLFSSLTLNAQHPEAKRANRWYFGNGAGLDFSSGTAVAITDGKLDSWESCASICDIDGNLLFYTDGDTVWDRMHNVMPNGTGLYGDCSSIINNSATQGVIIIPQPKSDHIFYVFTVDCMENGGAKGMNYSIVDLTLNSGLGDVVLKNQFLFSKTTEALAATMNCNRDSIWVVGHEFGTNAFYSYLVTKNGLELFPVISRVGIDVMNYERQMKFSPDGKKLFYYVELFDFNFPTGEFFNPKIVSGAGYGCSFSPDSRMLYFITGGNVIKQFDVTLNTSSEIMNSIEIIYHGSNNSEYKGGLQLGIDRKIYIAKNDTTKITTIDNPNNYGNAVNFNPYSVDLKGKKCQFTLPSFIENYFDGTNSNVICAGLEDIVSNVFTPNGDGINDTFVIEGCIECDELVIFNRWGAKIYESASALNGWDGYTYARHQCSEGIYYYILKQSGTEIRKGLIHLLH